MSKMQPRGHEVEKRHPENRKMHYILSIDKKETAMVHHHTRILRGTLSRLPQHAKFGCGKREANSNWSTVISEKAVAVTGTINTLYGHTYS